VRDGVKHGLGRAFEQVGEADVNLAFAETDGGVERGETAETDRDGGIGARGRRARYSSWKMGTTSGTARIQFTGASCQLLVVSFKFSVLSSL